VLTGFGGSSEILRTYIVRMQLQLPVYTYVTFAGYFVVLYGSVFHSFLAYIAAFSGILEEGFYVKLIYSRQDVIIGQYSVVGAGQSGREV
jgi:hypothetical protein